MEQACATLICAIELAKGVEEHDIGGKHKSVKSEKRYIVREIPRRDRLQGNGAVLPIVIVADKFVFGAPRRTLTCGRRRRFLCHPSETATRSLRPEVERDLVDASAVPNAWSTFAIRCTFRWRACSCTDTASPCVLGRCPCPSNTASTRAPTSELSFSSESRRARGTDLTRKTFSARAAGRPRFRAKTGFAGKNT